MSHSVHPQRMAGVSRVWIALLAVGAAAPGCLGIVEPPRGRGDDFGPVIDAPRCVESEAPPAGQAPLRRLSHTEYRNVVRDAFPDLAFPEVVLVPDDTSGGFENNAELLQVSPLLVEQYESTAAADAAIIAESESTWFQCDAGSCDEALVDELGLRLFRRPLEPAAKETFMALFDAQAEAIDRSAAVEIVAYAMLQDPEFLYRLELLDHTDPGLVELDGHAIAARMSFLFWGSSPDDELSSLADELVSPEVRESEARRMLEDPRAIEQLVDFHRQWLGLRRVDGQDRSTDVFPAWGPELGASIHEESLRFVRHVMASEGTLSALLTSREAWVDAEMAALYGVDPPAQDWDLVTLGPERSGILTRADFLTGTGHTSYASPPLRGVSVLTRVLCQTFDPPPDSADVSQPVSEAGTPITNRDLFVQRTASPACQQCHHTIDPVGYGFEAFDAIGAYRTHDNGIGVDASGQLPGGASFDGAVELSELLSERADVRLCTTTQMFRFAEGRGPRDEDGCRLIDLAADLEASGGDLREQLVAMVLRDEFVLAMVE